MIVPLTASTPAEPSIVPQGTTSGNRPEQNENEAGTKLCERREKKSTSKGNPDDFSILLGVALTNAAPPPEHAAAISAAGNGTDANDVVPGSASLNVNAMAAGKSETLAQDNADPKEDGSGTEGFSVAAPHQSSPPHTDISLPDVPTASTAGSTSGLGISAVSRDSDAPSGNRNPVRGVNPVRNLNPGQVINTVLGPQSVPVATATVDANFTDPSLQLPASGVAVVEFNVTKTTDAKSTKIETANPTVPQPYSGASTDVRADNRLKTMVQGTAESVLQHQKITTTDPDSNLWADRFWPENVLKESDRGSHSQTTDVNLATAENASTAPDITGISARVSGGLTQPESAFPMPAELRQPLSTQVSRVLLEHMPREGSLATETLKVRLDPPELGEMVLEISRTKEGLAVRVTAREAVTMDMLLARGHEIESHLRNGKIGLSTLEFLSSGMMNGGGSGDRQEKELFFGSNFSQQPGPQKGRRASTNDATAIRPGSAFTDMEHPMSFVA